VASRTVPIRQVSRSKTHPIVSLFIRHLLFELSVGLTRRSIS